MSALRSTQSRLQPRQFLEVLPLVRSPRPSPLQKAVQPSVRPQRLPMRRPSRTSRRTKRKRPRTRQSASHLVMRPWHHLSPQRRPLPLSQWPSSQPQFRQRRQQRRVLSHLPRVLSHLRNLAQPSPSVGAITPRQLRQWSTPRTRPYQASRRQRAPTPRSLQLLRWPRPFATAWLLTVSSSPTRSPRAASVWCRPVCRMLTRRRAIAAPLMTCSRTHRKPLQRSRRPS